MTTVRWVIGVPTAVMLSICYVLTQPDLISDAVRRTVSETLYPIFQYTAWLFGH